MIENIHTRVLNASPEQTAALIASLSSKADRLWPRQWWPAMRFDRPLAEGAVGGHGPIRYVVERYRPDESITFRFTGPRGFNGTHAFHIDPIDDHHTQLRHVLAMTTSGPAVLSWPLVFRPLHDALIEDSFNAAEASLLGVEPQPCRWSLYVRLLRWVAARLL
ncbi:MAG: SRPBCC family protein [Anaerolineae bacterium]